MKNILLASVAFVFVGTSAAFAAMPVLDLDPAFATVVPHDLLLLAKDGGDSSGSSSGSGGDDKSDSDDDNDSDDDDSNDDSNDDDSNDDSNQSNSNRRKPRIPGGSGCDDAGDVAEHAECRAQ